MPSPQCLVGKTESVSGSVCKGGWEQSRGPSRPRLGQETTAWAWGREAVRVPTAVCRLGPSLEGEAGSGAEASGLRVLLGGCAASGQ